MKLQTQIPINKETSNLINYDSRLILLGSCFSENIGNKLSYFKFQTHQNPFGILFHPKAIEKLITNVFHKKVYSEKDIIFQNERWHCFDAHSTMSSTDKNQLLNNLNTAILATKKSLKEATHIIITLGTSWIYRYIDTNTIVANCHKIQQKNFSKELLSVNEISKSLKVSTALLKSIHPTINVIFTVSPIRHLKDGFVENSQSKAHLIAGIHQVLEEQNSSYFPSYELMMDELRDYRFYAEDMIHPNTTAINYIWEKFMVAWFSDKTAKTMKAIDVIQKGLLHRPFNEKSSEHQKFLEKLEIKKSQVQEQFPLINF